MRRTIVFLCSDGPYHVPTYARVALFPLHLDPPTRQHRELFRLLLGAPDLATPSRAPQAAEVPSMGSSSPSTLRSQRPISASSAASGDAGLNVKFQNLMQQQMGSAVDGTATDGNATSSSNESTSNTTVTTTAAAPSFPDEDPISYGPSSSFWYMEAFATSLREDSQLAPFDDIILIPNTRGPVSLRQSAHLAALAVLATRGLAHVHVDFTALEHPDESMPIIYELVCKYTNCVLLHWLQDAYEMLNWSHFAEFKNTVPMLLLQTQSYPPRALERQRPLGSVSRLPSRQYHSHSSSYVRSPEEAEYYRNAERFINASLAMRRRNAAPMTLTSEGSYSDPDTVEQCASASLADRASDYFDDVPDFSLNCRRGDTTWHEDESDAMHRTSRSLHEGQTTTDTTAIHIAEAPQRRNNSESSRRESPVQRLSSTGHDWLGLYYTGCAKGRWWNTPGGRGDDEVELSRAYWSSTSSSWLGGGTTHATPSLPEWTEEVGTSSKTKNKNYRHHTAEDASTMNMAEGTGDSVPKGGAAAATPPGNYEAQSLDTVVSDHGFTLVVEEQAGGIVNRGKRNNKEVSPQATAQSKCCAMSESAARENADADTRKRYLTREIEDMRKMLDGMLHPTGGASAVASADDAAATTENSHFLSQRDVVAAVANSSSNSSSNSGGSGAFNATRTSRSLGGAFGPYEVHHHDTQNYARRRHRSVRQLIEELFPPRVYGSATAANAGPTAIGAMEDGIREYYSGSQAAAAANGSDGNNDTNGGGGLSRAVSSASIFNTAIKTTSTHLGLMKRAAMNHSKGEHDNTNSSNNNDDRITPNNSNNLSSWIDSPLVEVHPITRSTGADVRQALWEQEIHPSSILMDCVQRYMEGHGLYSDPRKTTAASLYAGVGANDFSGSARGGGGLGGSATDVSSGVGSAAGGVGSSAVGNTIMDGRTGIRRVAPRDTSTLFFPGLIPRLELHYDRNNLLAREQFEKLRTFQCQDGEEPDLIVPIGGDGYMMHCIRKNWRRFIPFYGVNAGHVGYLLNDRSTLEELFSSPLKLHFTTMLYCQAEKEGDTGERMLLSELAFNDAWVERSSGQTALIRILVNGQERIRRLRGDGVLVSTAAGSTAYSQALGASPVPVGAPLIQVVGSNVVSPAQWRPAHLDQEDQVEFEVIDSMKRPCRCYVDSVNVGNVTRLLVRSSRVAGVTLAFSKSCDLQHKLYQMQFPKTL